MASLKQTVSVEGLKELDTALGELTKATARNVLRRVLIKAGEPIREMAARLAPDDPSTAGYDLHSSIVVSAKIKNTVGNKEYNAVMRGGGTKQQAGAALRAARKAGPGGSFAEVFVGPKAGRNSKVGSLQEFGTSNHPAQPFMRPAFDANKDRALDIIKSEMGGEIAKAAKRAAARALKKKAKG